MQGQFISDENFSYYCKSLLCMSVHEGVLSVVYGKESRSGKSNVDS